MLGLAHRLDPGHISLHYVEKNLRKRSNKQQLCTSQKYNKITIETELNNYWYSLGGDIDAAQGPDTAVPVFCMTVL